MNITDKSRIKARQHGEHFACHQSKQLFMSLATTISWQTSAPETRCKCKTTSYSFTKRKRTFQFVFKRWDLPEAAFSLQSPPSGPSPTMGGRRGTDGREGGDGGRLAAGARPLLARPPRCRTRGGSGRAWAVLGGPTPSSAGAVGLILSTQQAILILWITLYCSDR